MQSCLLCLTIVFPTDITASGQKIYKLWQKFLTNHWQQLEKYVHIYLQRYIMQYYSAVLCVCVCVCAYVHICVQRPEDTGCHSLDILTLFCFGSRVYHRPGTHQAAKLANSEPLGSPNLLLPSNGTAGRCYHV